MFVAASAFSRPPPRPLASPPASAALRFPLTGAAWSFPPQQLRRSSLRDFGSACQPRQHRPQLPAGVRAFSPGGLDRLFAVHLQRFDSAPTVRMSAEHGEDGLPHKKPGHRSAGPGSPTARDRTAAMRAAAERLEARRKKTEKEAADATHALEELQILQFGPGLEGTAASRRSRVKHAAEERAAAKRAAAVRATAEPIAAERATVRKALARYERAAAEAGRRAANHRKDIHYSHVQLWMMLLVPGYAAFAHALEWLHQRRLEAEWANLTSAHHAMKELRRLLKVPGYASDVCPICLEAAEPADGLLPCGHNFHMRCLENHGLLEPCPVCAGGETRRATAEFSRKTRALIRAKWIDEAAAALLKERRRRPE